MTGTSVHYNNKKNGAKSCIGPIAEQMKTKGRHAWLLWCGALLLLLTGLYGVLIEPYRIRVHHVWINDPLLRKVIDTRIVVQLSDLHSNAFGKREQMVLAMLDALDPDIIFLTGDYVSWQGDVEPALHFLSLLHAKLGIWAVLGDYDYSRSRTSCLFCHNEDRKSRASRHAVHFLRNSEEAITLPGGILTIQGLDGSTEQNPMSASAVAPLHGAGPLIILSHSPLSFDHIGDERDTLILAGDTHGGQVALPAWVFSMMGYRKNALYTEGFFEQKKKKMYVSRGIGTSHLPVRLGRRPEMVVFHFSP